MTYYHCVMTVTKCLRTVTLFAWVIATEILFFKQFQDGVVPFQIINEHSREMECKSEVVSSTLFSNWLIVLCCNPLMFKVNVHFAGATGVSLQVEAESWGNSIMESTQQQYAPFTMVQRVVNVVTIHEEGEEDVRV